MIKAFPFTVFPLILFNLIAFVFPSLVTPAWDNHVFELGMFSGARWTVTSGDLMILVGLFFLFIEMLRSTVATESVLWNHLASVVILVVYIVEFIVVARAADSVFFILTAMALIDVLGGFTITTRAAARDVTVHEGY